MVKLNIGGITMLSDKEFNKRIGFLLGEKYRLDLKWNSVIYNENICYFKNATFSGPAIQFAERVEPNNMMLLDFFKQYFMFAKTAYIANFSWGDIKYLDNNIILLGNAKLEHDSEINKVPKMRNTDYVVINTTNHDAEKHIWHPTYDSVVVNELGEAYNFWNVEGHFRKV